MIDVYEKFAHVRYSVFLATDVAALGLNFLDFDWVIQLHYSEDVKFYIHRVERTARNDKSGKSLMVLSQINFPIRN